MWTSGFRVDLGVKSNIIVKRVGKNKDKSHSEVPGRSRKNKIKAEIMSSKLPVGWLIFRRWVMWHFFWGKYANDLKLKQARAEAENWKTIKQI